LRLGHFFTFTLQQKHEANMRKVSPIKIEIVSQGRVQADIAQAAEMSESRLSRIVNGRVEPREYELKKLRKAFGLNPGDAI
jgi:transcriptional regulator with XRE-family HTH domain